MAEGFTNRAPAPRRLRRPRGTPSLTVRFTSDEFAALARQCPAGARLSDFVRARAIGVEPSVRSCSEEPRR